MSSRITCDFPPPSPPETRPGSPDSPCPFRSRPPTKAAPANRRTRTTIPPMMYGDLLLRGVGVSCISIFNSPSTEFVLFRHESGKGVYKHIREDTVAHLP